MKALNIPEIQVKVVKAREEYRDVLALRNQVYRKIYPAIKSQHSDIYDFGVDATVFYSRDDRGRVTSSSRLVLDDHQGLPSEKHIQQSVTTYRKQGLKLAEFGKFVNACSSTQLVKLHHRAIYSLALHWNVDVVVMVAPQKRQTLYVKWIGATLLLDDIHESFGSKQAFAAFAWPIKQTKQRFYRWASLKQSPASPAYFEN